jgi:hypothetical protein
MFFKHTALVFAYTAYISIAALIVLKMAARGGYADQVGMTHPLARLFMIAIISAVAIGVFWWLKRELGDHTRQDLTRLVTDLNRRTREGYQRGQDAYDRARNLNSRAPWTKNQASEQRDSPDGPDQPLTGSPAGGRRPGGRPPSPAHQRSLAPGPQPPSTAPAGAAATTSPATAVNATRAAGGVAAGGEAAAVVAPEAVAGAAIASHITQRLHHDHTARSSQTNAQPTNSATPRAQSGPPPGSTQLPAEPVAGRTSTSWPNPSQRPSPAPATGRDRPNTRPLPDHGDPLDEAPVKGR